MSVCRVLAPFSLVALVSACAEHTTGLRGGVVAPEPETHINAVMLSPQSTFDGSQFVEGGIDSSGGMGLC